MNNRLSFLLTILGIFLLGNYIFAQGRVITPKVQRYNASGSFKKSPAKNIKVLALMVEFQKDTEDLTVGNGLFDSIYTKNYKDTILDPMPHDSAYFAAHLLFAKNYFNRVSNKELSVNYTVLPNRIQLTKTMDKYSPDVASSDFTNIATMINEAWTLYDKTYPGFSYKDYDLFVIFHAGVGRDVSMPGSLGNELDIPSVFLDSTSLKKYMGSSFTGVPVSNGTFHINNSIILPQTENRELISFGNSSLVQLSMNGLIVSSIGSYLGLPDLFNTKTGYSAIGRFGLMDGQAIFAYSGVFPPEPSAWEKIDLGWINPVTLPVKDSAKISVINHFAAKDYSSTILKIPITEKEYFLVENRQRDANKDGAVVSYYSTGVSKQRTFYKDTTGFYSWSVDSLRGVITDIDEPDWALPGSGLLVWHIDESVIDAKRASNEINNDKTHAGVKLMQASGIPSIGEVFYTATGDQFVGEGYDDDLWYKGNTSKLYRNIFDDNSRPSARANSGAKSLITMKDFTSIADTMYFSLLNSLDGITKKSSLKLSLPSTNNRIYSTTVNGFKRVLIQSGKDLLIYDSTFALLKTVPSFSSRKTSVIGNYIVGLDSLKLNCYDASNLSGAVSSYTCSETISTDAVLSLNNEVSEIRFGTKKGNLLTFFYNGTALTLQKSDIIYGGEMKYVSDSASTNYVVFQKGSSFGVGNYNTELSSGEGNVVDCNFALTLDGKKFVVVLTDNNRFQIFRGAAAYSDFSLPFSDSVKSFSLLDLKLDGTPYIVFTAGSKLYAYNMQGSCAENFPVSIGKLTNGNAKTSAVMTSDNSSVNLYTLTDDGFHIVNAKTAKEYLYSPISINGSLTSQPYIYNSAGNTYCVTIDGNSNLTEWQVLTPQGKILFSGENGNIDGGRTAFFTTKSILSTELMPAAKAYNYPNPVYNGETFFRFYLSEDCKVQIKVFDLAGDYVASLEGNGRGGYDNELKWNVSNIQSGIYLAHLEATSVSGKTAVKIIKVAVIK